MKSEAGTGKFSWESAIKGKALIVRMTGNITEDTQLTKVLGDLIVAGGTTADSMYFDLRGILAINSPGVRDWLMFMEKTQSRYLVRFLSVGECLIEQASMVPTIFGKAGTPVDSFEAPYQCNTCNLRRVVFLKTKDVLAASPADPIQPPVVKCEKCGQPLQFDAFEEDFFQFLRHAAYVR